MSPLHAGMNHGTAIGSIEPLLVRASATMNGRLYYAQPRVPRRLRFPIVARPVRESKRSPLTTTLAELNKSGV